MTGMPASLAFVTPGFTAVPSCARMTTTFAPWVMRFSMFESCVSDDDFASFEM